MDLDRRAMEHHTETYERVLRAAPDALATRLVMMMEAIDEALECREDPLHGTQCKFDLIEQLSQLSPEERGEGGEG